MDTGKKTDAPKMSAHHEDDDMSSSSVMERSCRSPKTLPWVNCDQCMKWFVPVYITKEIQRQSKEFTTTIRFQIEVLYEHCLELKGLQQGKLLYTTSLIPKEELKIFTFDRYRKTKSEEARMTTHTSFRQSVAAAFQSKHTTDSSVFAKNISSIRAEYDTSGSLLGFLGGNADASASSVTETQAGIRATSENFFQLLTSSSSVVEAERSLMVSSFEETESVNTTSRILKNYNDCYAVTYYIRRINEVYYYHSKIVSIRWRILGERISAQIGGWHTMDELGLLNNKEVETAIQKAVDIILKEGRELKEGRCISLPTDGTFLETELASCSSCEATRMKEVELRLAREEAEIGLLNAEIARRQKLIDEDKLDEFVKPAPIIYPGS